MDDLVTWLRAPFDEDERVARQMTAGCIESGVYLEAESESTDLMAAMAHMYRWSPARVLREVEAKRRIVDLHAPVPVNFGDEWACPECGSGPLNVPCVTLRLLALPYADRPGYRDEWRP